MGIITQKSLITQNIHGSMNIKQQIHVVSSELCGLGFHPLYGNFLPVFPNWSYFLPTVLLDRTSVSSIVLWTQNVLVQVCPLEITVPGSFCGDAGSLKLPQNFNKLDEIHLSKSTT